MAASPVEDKKKKKTYKKLPSIYQLKFLRNIFKWSLFILFDFLSELGTMEGAEGRVRWGVEG